MAKVISKKDIKDAVLEALEPFAVSIAKDFAKVETKIADSARGTGVILEHMDNKWDLVAEQYEGLTKNIGEIKSDITGMKGEITGIKSDITGIKRTLNGHTEMIGKLAEDVEIIKEQLDPAKPGSLPSRVLTLEKVRK